MYQISNSEKQNLRNKLFNSLMFKIPNWLFLEDFAAYFTRVVTQ